MSMESRWCDTDRGNWSISMEACFIATVSLKISHGLAWNWTLVFTMRDRGLIAQSWHGVGLFSSRNEQWFCLYTKGPYIFHKSSANTRRRNFGWHEVSFTQKTPSSGAICEPVVRSFLFGACELINVVVCKGASANIILKMLGASVQSSGRPDVRDLSKLVGCKDTGNLV
jgi:hypothetical protein